MTGPPITGAYPADWPTIAARVKTAAEWQCVRCQTPHDPASGYMLGVHHMDGDKSNCAGWNLAALCQRCHLRIQARVDLRQPILIAPSVWSMPYIAGFLVANDLAAMNPCFVLAEWIAEYKRVGPWPAWAPVWMVCGAEFAA